MRRSKENKLARKNVVEVFEKWSAGGERDHNFTMHKKISFNSKKHGLRKMMGEIQRILMLDIFGLNKSVDFDGILPKC